jgi:dsDNA-binding SOS-regulon protein
MATWADEYLTLIEDCEHRSERLSDWEAQFIDSLRRQLENGKTPSPKQVDVLDNIWEKVTRRG